MGTLDEPTGSESKAIKLDIVTGSMDETTASPHLIYDPAVGGFKPHLITLTVHNKDANSFINIDVEVKVDGDWHDLLRVGVQNKDIKTHSINLLGSMKCKKIRLNRSGSSTNWYAKTAVTYNQKG